MLPQAAFPCRGTELRYFLIISSGYQHTVPVVQQPGRRHPIHYIHLTAEVLFDVCTNCGFWTFRKRSPTGLCGEMERLRWPKRSSEQFSSRTYLRGQHVVKGIQEKQHQHHRVSLKPNKQKHYYWASVKPTLPLVRWSPAVYVNVIKVQVVSTVSHERSMKSSKTITSDGRRAGPNAQLWGEWLTGQWIGVKNIPDWREGWWIHSGLPM